MAILTIKRSLQIDRSWEKPIVNHLPMFMFGVTKALYSEHLS